MHLIWAQSKFPNRTTSPDARIVRDVAPSNGIDMNMFGRTIITSKLVSAAIDDVVANQHSGAIFKCLKPCSANTIPAMIHYPLLPQNCLARLPGQPLNDCCISQLSQLQLCKRALLMTPNKLYAPTSGHSCKIAGISLFSMHRLLQMTLLHAV